MTAENTSVNDNSDWTVVNYQLDAQFLYSYIYHTFTISLCMFQAPLCSSSGGQIVLRQRLVLSLSDSPLLAGALSGHCQRVTIPDAVLIQFDLLMMSIIVLETCRGI
jgi:hypothetical protein